MPDATVKLKASPAVQYLLRCPVCRAALTPRITDLQCSSSACARAFPVLDGMPVLINEESSVFSISEVVARHGKPAHAGRLRTLASRFVPHLSLNVNAAANYRKFGSLLPPEARVLVVGSGSGPGHGMSELSPTLQLVRTDIAPRGVDVICDAHDLPFEDASFDAVILQAMLEAVADPYRCVEEAHRVLKNDGVVYAETPFMQQVHVGPYDFTRFSHLGHRRLFRRFSEIDSGAVCGPGMTLAWAYRYFLVSFVRTRRARLLLRAFSGFTAFFLLWFDRWLIDRPGALDTASAVYFLGRKSDATLSDRELIKLYRGLDHT
jgi:SAM-dependent methyltransferase